MPYKDKKKQLECQKRFYQRNKDKVKQENKERKIKLKVWFQEYKSTLKCSKCIEDHPATLDFHHLRDKEDTVSNIVARGKSKENILKEINKCIVLCANCHRKLHAVGEIES